MKDTFTQEQLLFVVSPPRSGSTLLQRMLGSHTAIGTHPEPHIITPLAHLGFDGIVDAAPYDHINSAEAIKLFVDHLPNKEHDYYDSLRSYTDGLYGKMLRTMPEKSVFMDKTPAYALVLPFLARLYPSAKYVVLTRHPLAVFSSFANSFFEGDWAAAHAFNPLVERYVPAMAKFLRDKPAPYVHVSYETLVRQPEAELERVFGYLGLEHQPEAANYGDRFDGSKQGPGDPIGVHQHSRPVAASVEKWAEELAHDEKKLALARRMIDSVSDDDLATWGTPRAELWKPLESAGGGKPPKRVVNSYTLQRRVFLALRKDIDKRPHGKLLRKVKYYCDVLLRE
ncbi:MAG: sulfotransferase [Polyangiales bacterium]